MQLGMLWGQQCDLVIWPYPSPDLELARSCFELVESQNWEDRLAWSKRHVSRCNVWHTTWPWTVTLAVDFSRSNFEVMYPRNMRVSAGTKYLCFFYIDRTTVSLGMQLSNNWLNKASVHSIKKSIINLRKGWKLFGIKSNDDQKLMI